MRWRVLALVSLGVNLALAAVWLSIWRQPATGPSAGASAGSSTNRNRPVLVVRRQFFSWQEVESDDYPTYIANLRDIGCPEQTIRDIIIADVNALYARRRALEVVTPMQQWWRSQPDANLLRAAAQKARALDAERRTLLASLLGASWEGGDLVNLPRPSRQTVVLDGPMLGGLAGDVKQAVEEISARSGERMQAYLEAQQALGKPADAADLAKLRQQTREELARVLAPPQLEEFLLRYSQEANNLRAEFGELKYFDPPADEFRAVFRATDALDQRIAALEDATDSANGRLRQALEEQREAAIKNALGPRRYEEYRNLQDPLYRDAVATAEQNGNPEAARSIYQVSLAAAAQQNSILNDTNLTPDQRNIALKNLELDQLKANAIVSGQELPPEPPPPPTPTPRRTYTLRPGDSAAVVGLIYGVPESAIRAANPGVNLNRLKAGDTIFIPRNALAPGPAPR
jgi:hypothetical protein